MDHDLVFYLLVVPPVVIRYSVWKPVYTIKRVSRRRLHHGAYFISGVMAMGLRIRKGPPKGAFHAAKVFASFFYKGVSLH
jgi:hypothetical protein